MSKTKEFVFKCEHMGGTTWTVEHQWAIEGEADEIVRCRDCELAEQPEDQGGITVCMRTMDCLDGEGLGYCAWGVRRDES